MIDKLAEQVDRMTLEEKVGQLFLVRFDASNKELPKVRPAGYLLEKGAFNMDKATFKALVSDLTEKGIPPFLAVDEEGGNNCSISSSKNFRKRRFRSVKELKSLTDVMIDSTEKLKLMKEIGVNMNFGISANHATTRKAYCYPGSYSRSIDEVASYVDFETALHNEFKVIPVIKDFPGYGDAKYDKGAILDNRTLSYIISGLTPFIAAIRRGAPAILIAGSVITQADFTPACLEEKIYSLLRNTIGFQGVIISNNTSNAVKHDDVVHQIELGSNLVICNNDAYESQKNLIIQGVNDGFLSEENIDTSVLKVLFLKKMYQII